MKLPILFFFGIHNDPATYETLQKLLPTLWEIGYKHVCSDTDTGHPIEKVIDLLQEDIQSTDEVLRQTEGCDLSRAPTELLAQLETYKIITKSSRIQLPFFKAIKSSKFKYHGIDLPGFIEGDTLENCKKVLIPEINEKRESHMTEQIKKLRSTLNGGLVVIMGLTHYKLARKICPDKDFSAFHLYYDERNLSSPDDATLSNPTEERDIFFSNMRADKALKVLLEKLPVKHTPMRLLGSTTIDEALFFKTNEYLSKIARPEATPFHKPDPILAITDEYLFALRNGLPIKEWLTIEQHETARECGIGFN